MIKRWSFYLLVGGLFGIFDFYFQYWMQQIFPARMGNIMLILILGVWLVMVIPIAIREVKASHSAWLAAAASAFTWPVSIVSYYLFMGVKLILTDSRRVQPGCAPGRHPGLFLLSAQSDSDKM